MNSVECGELVYVPSQAMLFRIDADLNIKDYNVLKHPLNLLVTKKDADGLIGVHFQGKTWLLKEKDVY